MLVVIDCLHAEKGDSARTRPLEELVHIDPAFIHLTEHKNQISPFTKKECFGYLTTRGIDVFDLAFLGLDLNMGELNSLSDSKCELYYFELNEPFSVAVSKVIVFLARMNLDDMKLTLSYDGRKAGDRAEL